MGGKEQVFWLFLRLKWEIFNNKVLPVMMLLVRLCATKYTGMRWDLTHAPHWKYTSTWMHCGSRTDLNIFINLTYTSKCCWFFSVSYKPTLIGWKLAQTLCFNKPVITLVSFVDCFITNPPSLEELMRVSCYKTEMDLQLN